jgi:SNF2 family DNA or RNA helicase
MGLGKTAIGLTAIADIKEKWESKSKRRFKWLVIAPIKVCETVWRQEAKLWEHTKHLEFSLVRGNEKQRAFALHKEADVYLINPELVKWLREYLRGDWSKFDALIVDESSLFKDHKSKRFRKLTNYATRETVKGPDGKSLKDEYGKPLYKPPHTFKRTVIFTGTPRPNSSANLWSQLYILDHGERLLPKFDHFRNRFFHFAGRIGEHTIRYEENEDIPDDAGFTIKPGAPQKIHELIADISVELDASEYNILPDILPLPRMVELPNDVMARYKALEKDALIELQENTIIAQNGGVKSMMCWQFANGAMYNPVVDAAGKRTHEVIHDLMLDELDELLEEVDENFLIPYQFVHDRERILARHPDAVVLPRSAEKIIERWNAGGIRKLLIHPRSGSHGLNIQYGGHNIAWFGMLWSNEQWMQTNRRLARPGQPEGKGVTAHLLMAAGTIHELQYASLCEKGGEETRFREALRKYQKAQNLGIYTHEFYKPVF